MVPLYVSAVLGVVLYGFNVMIHSFGGLIIYFIGCVIGNMLSYYMFGRN